MALSLVAAPRWACGPDVWQRCNRFCFRSPWHHASVGLQGGDFNPLGLVQLSIWLPPRGEIFVRLLWVESGE